MTLYRDHFISFIGLQDDGADFIVHKKGSKEILAKVETVSKGIDYIDLILSQEPINFNDPKAQIVLSHIRRDS